MTQSKKMELEEGSWFADLLMCFAPSKVDTSGKTPAELMARASWKAFAIGTAAAIPPGPLGWATILPEMASVTKIQINLIYDIAEHYKQRGKLNKTLVMMIFANEAGIEVGMELVERVGKKLVIRALGSKLLRPIVTKIGARLGVRITQRMIGRWVPVVLAPAFGAFSKKMTTQIGKECVKLFQEDLEIVEARQEQT